MRNSTIRSFPFLAPSFERSKRSRATRRFKGVARNAATTSTRTLIEGESENDIRFINDVEMMKNVVAEPLTR